MANNMSPVRRDEILRNLDKGEEVWVRAKVINALLNQLVVDVAGVGVAVLNSDVTCDAIEVFENLQSNMSLNNMARAIADLKYEGLMKQDASGRWSIRSPYASQWSSVSVVTSEMVQSLYEKHFGRTSPF